MWFNFIFPYKNDKIESRFRPDPCGRRAKEEPMKILLLIMFWATSVTIPAAVITLAALGESIRHMEDPERGTGYYDVE